MAEHIQLPAPVGGINGHLSEYGLPPQYAAELVNLIPYGGMLCPRLPFNVEVDTSVMDGTIPRWMHVYTKADGDQLIVMTEAANWYVFNPDMSMEDSSVGLGDVIEQSVSFNFDGKAAWTRYPALAPIAWDGTSGSSISFTMPGAGEWSSATAPQITGGHPFKNRVYWWSEQYRSFVYTALNAIGGELEYFPLATVAQTGGTVRCITSLTMDGGAGPDDYLAVVLTTGEALIYQGSDPGDSNDWSLVGRFIIPPPVHGGATVRMGGDVLMLTKQGLIPLQQFMKATMGQFRVDWLDAINPILRDELNDQRAPVGMMANIAYLPSRRWLAAITGPVFWDRPISDGLFGSCRIFVGDSGAWTTFEARIPATSDPNLDFPDKNLRNPSNCFGIIAMAEANGTVYATVRTRDADEPNMPCIVSYKMSGGLDMGIAPIRCGWARGHLPLEPDSKFTHAEVAWSHPDDEDVEIRRWYYKVSYDFQRPAIIWSREDSDADVQDVMVQPFSMAGIGSSWQETVIFDMAYTGISTERAVRLYKTEARIERVGAEKDR